MFKHLLRGSQIFHVTITAQNSSENVRICPMGCKSTFLNLFSLSLPQIQIVGYRGVVTGKRLEGGSKDPMPLPSDMNEWVIIDYFRVWKLLLSLLLENTSVSSTTLSLNSGSLCPSLAMIVPLLHEIKHLQDQMDAAPYRVHTPRPLSSDQALDSWATGIPTRLSWAQFQSLVAWFICCSCFWGRWQSSSVLL